MAAEPLLEVQGVSKSFEGPKALSDVSPALAPNEILGLIGPNGAGKTTLFNVVAGAQRPDRVTGSGLDRRGSGLDRVGSDPGRVEGFPVDRYLAQRIAEDQDHLAHFAESRRLLHGADGPRRAGERMASPDLTRSLDAVAREGADALYAGSLAGCRVWSMSPPSAGALVIAVLQALDGRLDGAALAPEGPETTSLSVVDRDGNAVSLTCSDMNFARAHHEAGIVDLERSLAVRAGPALEARGWRLDPMDDHHRLLALCRAVAVDADGRITGAGDPRGDGVAVAEET